MWKYLTHPNIVPFLGITSAPRQLISEWMPGGDLLGYIEGHPDADRLGLVCTLYAVFIARLPQSPAIRRIQGPPLPPLL